MARPIPDGGGVSAGLRVRLNILVSGGAGAGKTTTSTYMLCSSPEECIAVVEDAAELQLHQEHVSGSNPTPNIEGRGEVRIRDLVRKRADAPRPDRGRRVRDEAALDMLQAMNTHDGSVCTVPCVVTYSSNRDDGSDGRRRAARARDPRADPRAIDLIVHLPDQGRHPPVVTRSRELGGDITLQDVFRFDHNLGFDEGRSLRSPQSTGLRPTFLDKLAAHGTLDFGSPPTRASELQRASELSQRLTAAAAVTTE